MKDNSGILICECHSTEHQVVFHQNSEEKEIYMHILLNKYSFFKRLIVGIKYIFGYQSKYGMFDEIIITKNNIGVLEEVVDFINE